VLLGYTEYSELYKDDKEELFDMRTPNDAPCILYQQAFRWFREKYGLDNAVLKDRFVIETEDMLPYWFYGFKTYEEAELTCLIKLIEIVKQK
jgi:hypothetical protein